MATLLQLVEALARDPEAKAAYQAGPDAYLRSNGYGGLDTHDVEEALAQVADTVPPVMAAQLSPAEGFDGVAALDPTSFDGAPGGEDPLAALPDELPLDDRLDDVPDRGPDHGLDDGLDAAAVDGADDGQVDGADDGDVERPAALTTDGAAGSDLDDDLDAPPSTGDGPAAFGGAEPGAAAAPAADAAPTADGLDLDDAVASGDDAAGPDPFGQGIDGSLDGEIDRGLDGGLDGDVGAPGEFGQPFDNPFGDPLSSPFDADPTQAPGGDPYQSAYESSLFEVEESDILDDVDSPSPYDDHGAD